MKFDKNRNGILMTLTVMKPKAKQIRYELLMRDHDKAADDFARFIQQVADKTNLE